VTDNTRPILTTEEAPAVAPTRVLLKPSYTPARTGTYFQQHYDYLMVPAIVNQLSYSSVVAVDFETCGNDISDPDLFIVGIGLAFDSGSCYFDWWGLSKERRQMLIDALLDHPCVVAHNVYFDGGLIRAKHNSMPTNMLCTLALYMMLSNEGWAGQTWGLKSAQTDILLWTDTNEGELDQWLITNCYYKGNLLKDNTPTNLLARAMDGSLSPDKGEMWRAPADILGKYCILDAESCYLLYKEHLAPCLEQFPDFKEWFREKWMHHIFIHIDQKLNGILVDKEGLAARRKVLLDTIADLDAMIRNHPDLIPHIKKIEEELLKELLDRKPEQYNKQKPNPPAPPRYTKDGKESKNYLKWQANINAGKYEPKVSQLYINWQNKVMAAETGLMDDYKFNVRSGQQLIKLFYDGGLGYPVRVVTESGLPGTGVKALKHFGEVGKLFVDLAYTEKELSYIQDYLDRTEHRNTIHPSFRLPGTKTGRLSSSRPNLQQVPKSKAVMGLFKAKPGHVWVDLDFSALEPTVATEFSQDKNMRLIYADGRPPNDMYLFVASSIPGIREKVLAAGYDPLNPTKEGIANAKKVCKAERNICKTVTLACQYGAGVNKVIETLEQDDVFLPREQVEAIHKGYWELFRDLKQFGYRLKDRLVDNGGYVLNGLGRPMCVAEGYEHDILNRFIQSTGHDILVEYVIILKEVLDQNNIPWQPLIIDLHDSTCVEVPEQYGQQVADLFLTALDVLNSRLNGSIKLKGIPTIGTDLATVKEAEE
jgi:hypothetical protein